MGEIVAFLKSIVDAITTAINFVVDFISDIVYIIELVGKTVLEIPSYFGWLPTAAVGILVTIFGIVVIYKITGREG